MHFSVTYRMKHKGESQLFVSVSAASKLSPPGSVPKSAISPISAESSISSGEDIEEIEDFDSEQMPTFSESVTDLRPSLLSQIAAKAVSLKDADLLLPDSLTTFSACLPNVYGIYGGREMFPNLLLFVTAQASAGKGRLTLCRHLV
jgi:hypothetical protein